MNPAPEPQPVTRINGWALAVDKAPLFFSILLVFFVPFITQVDGMDSIYPKLALTQILVLMILAAWMLKVTWTSRMVWIQTNAFWPLVGLLAWLALTVIFSPYQSVGWQALAHWICFPLWYVLLTLLCYELWRAENILIVFLMGALGTALWALAQAFGLDSGAWSLIVKDQFGGRVTAGLGNPDFLAGYLLMVWPIALALYFRAVQPITKFLWVSLMLITFLALVFTSSKAGILSFYFSLLVYLIFFFQGSKGSDWFKKNKILLAAAVICVGAFFIGPTHKALTGLMDSANPSIQFREEVWKGTVEMIREHPWTGVGFGAFSAAFPSYRPISLMMSQTQRSYEVNHAHNWVLEWTAETGWAGLALLLAFWGYVLYQWWRLYKANAIPRALGAGAFALFAGVACDNLFDLNCYLPSTLVPLLFFAAMPVALSQRFLLLEGYPIRRKDVDLTAWKAVLLPAAMLIGALCVWDVNLVLHQQLADVLLKRANGLSMEKKWDQAIPLYQQVLDLDKDKIEARYFLGAAELDRAGEGDAEKALADLDKVVQTQPDYVLVHFKRAEALERLGRGEDSRNEMKKAIRLDPALIFQLEDYKKARALADSKKFNDALVIYQKLVFDYPTCVPALVDYGNCLVMTRKYPDADVYYKRALGLDPGNQEALKNSRQLEAVQRP